MIFRPSRERRGPDRLLGWKIALFTLGAALGLVGMASDSALLVGAAIAALGIGILLRFLDRRSDSDQP